MDKYMEANRRSWDARTPTHFVSRFYDVDGFRAGASDGWWRLEDGRASVPFLFSLKATKPG